MAKPATNRTNFRYASQIRKKGFLTAIHVLPEIKEYVDTRLAEGVSENGLANEINQRFGEQIKATGWLKPISRGSISNYRNRYWKHTPQFKKVVINGSEAVKEEIKKLLYDFDALKMMIKWAKKQDEKAELADNLEDRTNLPSKRGDEARLQAYDMAKVILEKEVELGLIEAPSGSSDEGFVSGSLKLDFGNRDEIIKQAKEAILAIEGKGKYEKRELIGKRIGSAGGKK